MKLPERFEQEMKELLREDYPAYRDSLSVPPGHGLRVNENRISTYSELIIGLPGETYDSFCDGLCAMLENGQHFAVNAYPCELIPNSEMAQPWYIRHYQLRSMRIPFRVIHSAENDGTDDIVEFGEYVISTCSMNEQDWVQANVFSNYVQGLHNLGHLRAVAIFCRHELNIPYVDFYRDLIAYSRSRPDSFLGRLYSKIYGLCSGVLSRKNAFVAPCEGTGGLLWCFDEILFLEAYRDLPRFYAEIREWLKHRFQKHEAFEALFTYQYAIIKKINQPVVTIEAEYDFYSYFNGVFLNAPVPLEKKPIRLLITDPSPVSTFVQFARETVWYGRNRRETDYSSSHYPVQAVDISG